MKEYKSGDVYFKVYDEKDAFLGDCKIVYNNHLENSLEIGYIIKKEFWKKGIGTIIHYPVPPHLQECYKNLGYKEGHTTSYPYTCQYYL